MSVISVVTFFTSAVIIVVAAYFEEIDVSTTLTTISANTVATIVANYLTAVFLVVVIVSVLKCNDIAATVTVTVIITVTAV